MNMCFDNATEIFGAGTEFIKRIKKHSINSNVTEPYSHWQNLAEDGIKQIKFIWKSNIRRTGCSQILWDYGMKQDA